MQEIVAETQAERNNRENESYFREQPAEQNSSPVDCCTPHFPTPVPHVERSAIVATCNESKPPVKALLTPSGNYFRVTSCAKVIPIPDRTITSGLRKTGNQFQVDLRL